MEVLTLTVGQLQTNTYIAIDQDNKICVIIDPAAECKRIIETVDREGLDVKGILVTHGHFDHIGAVNQLSSYYKVPVIAHEGEANMMSDSMKNMSVYFLQRAVSSVADTFVEDGEEIGFGGKLIFQCIEVPGHTEHSICFYQQDEHIVFTGDTLMAGAIGRTDLFDGPEDLLFHKIMEKLIVLPKITAVYPGHGHATTIENEKNTNPYINGFYYQ